jgi:hypothetical protein
MTLLAVVGGVYAAVLDQPAAPGADAANAEHEVEADTGPAATGAQGALSGCAAHLAAGEAVVAAARVGVAHWATHVQARTDMLSGAITAEQMKALWKRTRLAGPTDLRRFSAALAGYDSSGQQCSNGALQAVATEHAEDVEDCLARFAATTEAVQAADLAIGDWEHHLDMMAEFAEGGMTAEQAQEMWVRAWRTAPTNIDAYEAGRSAVAQAPACGEPGG